MSGSFFPYLLLLLWAVLALVVGVLYRRVRQQTEDTITPLYLDQLQQQISDLQRDLARVVARQEKQHLPSEPDISPYNQAIEMIRQGMSAHEVASRCGISRSEAELIVSLYRNSSTS